MQESVAVIITAAFTTFTAITVTIVRRLIDSCIAVFARVPVVGFIAANSVKIPIVIQVGTGVIDAAFCAFARVVAIGGMLVFVGSYAANFTWNPVGSFVCFPTMIIVIMDNCRV